MARLRKPLKPDSPKPSGDNDPGGSAKGVPFRPARRLTWDQEDVLRQRIFEHKTLEEIGASRNGTTPSTVKKLLCKGLDNLGLPPHVTTQVLTGLATDFSYQLLRQLFPNASVGELVGYLFDPPPEVREFSEIAALLHSDDSDDSESLLSEDSKSI